MNVEFNLLDFIRKFGAEKTGTPQQPANGSRVSPLVSADDAANARTISNGDVLQYVTAHFRTEMDRKSFCNVVTFPMSFTVILNRKDYDAFKDYSRVVSKHIILAFYDAIKEKLTEGKVVEPLATYWNISFLQCDEEPVTVNQDVVMVNQGEYYICSTVHDKLVDSLMKSPTGSRIAVSKGGSQLFANVNINRESLDRLRVVGETHIQMDWEPMMSSVHVRHEPAHLNFCTTLAKLSGQGKTFHMTGDSCLISGKYETRKDKNIFIVNSEFVANGHVQIQYMEKERKFRIAAFEYTELNGQEMRLSTGTDKQWMDLVDGATIHMANDVVLSFNKLMD